MTCKSWKTPKGALEWTVGLAAAGVAVLVVFGDPEWNRFIFLFQNSVLKRNVDRPANFTGTQKAWHSNGKLAALARCTQGSLDGLVSLWYSNGAKQSEMNYIRGSRQGVWTTWGTNGEQLSKCTYKDDEPWDGVCQIWNGKGFLGVYKEGKPWRGYLPVWNDEKEKQDWYYYFEGSMVTKDKYFEATHLPENSRLIGID